MTQPDRQAVIVGVAESDPIGIVPDKSALQLQAEATRNALREPGLNFRDVDRYLTAGIEPQIVAEYLEIKLS